MKRIILSTISAAAVAAIALPGTAAAFSSLTDLPSISTGAQDDGAVIAKRGRGKGGNGGGSGSGRDKPRVPGGSGCDDPGDVAEHPECRA